MAINLVIKILNNENLANKSFNFKPHHLYKLEWRVRSLLVLKIY